ncbi:MAG TPA: hypothetical protein VG963_09680, partial [Polyangiaceae bacterium]|nr:hypothetical protein [Polyangiaceae bacterium]
MFAQDRDLLALEPNLFRDVSWTGQFLAQDTCVLASGALVVNTIDLEALAVNTGMVVLVNNQPLEVILRADSSTLQVSLLRSDPADNTRPPADQSSATVRISTFLPQLGIVHAQLLRMFGLMSTYNWYAQGQPAGVATELGVLNPSELVLMESLGALHLIYSAASALLGSQSPAAERAELYRQRFAEERWRAKA